MQLKNQATMLRVAPILALLGGLLLAASATMLGGRGDAAAQANCDPSYPDFCIANDLPSLTCEELEDDQRNFRALPPDQYLLDPDFDGIACEDDELPMYPTPEASPTAEATETSEATATETGTVGATETATGTVSATASVSATATQTTSGELPYRLFNVFVACDNCSGNPGTPTATPTISATPTGGTTTPTSTASPTGTTTPETTTPTVTATGTPDDTTPTTVPTATPTVDPAICSGSSATITNVSKASNPETVTISGSGDMTGWSLLSATGEERFTFPDGYMLDGEVEIRSGPGATANPPAALLWTTDEVWADSATDLAILLNCEEAFRSIFPNP